jgi:formate hydrogenlyase subunit 3/multisubunit Na+/H+ antiporter MnhD subunit
MLVLGAGALATLLASSRRTLAGWLAFAATAAAGGLIFYAVGKTLFTGPDAAANYWLSAERGLGLRLYVDGLSALFLGIIMVVALPAVFYSIRYLDHYAEYSAGRYYPHLLLFLAGMVGLVSTSDTMLFFLFFWQLMTLTSFALVRFEHRVAANRHAAWIYLFMMQLACAAILLGMALLVTGGAKVGEESLGRFEFESVMQGMPGLLADHSGRVTLALALLLVGFGIKAGMWPFGQIWLPDAHPAAPSPVSALLSGVMIKTGVYGLARCFLWLMPAADPSGYPLETWGWIITVLGTITLTVGTAQALRQEQTKRLLAFSSIGQVGYILLGLGMCVLLVRTPLAELAVRAMCGALFHTMNHAVFKGLLFLNAGSMVCATGTQDMSRAGGLMKYMPVTGLCTLVGAVAIAGAPLTSGFASKWCLYGAAIRGAGLFELLPVCASFAVMTSVVTLAVFVRFYGATFLSRASTIVREKAAAGTRMEPGWMMLGPKVFLAGICIVLGLAPMLGVRAVLMALANSRQGLGELLAGPSPLLAGAVGGLSSADLLAVISPLAVAGVLGLMILLARAISRVGGATRRAAVPWLCGYAREAEHNRYHSRHFFGELQRYLRWAGGVKRGKKTEQP